MTRTSTSERSLLEKKRTYRRLTFGSLVAGVTLAVLLREVLGYPLVSEVVYWLGVVGFFAVGFGTSVSLFDERERAIERRASQLTLTLLAPVLAIVASLGRLLPRFTDYSVPATVGHALYGILGVYVVFGVVYAALRYRT